jgi:hypothetical protein
LLAFQKNSESAVIFFRGAERKKLFMDTQDVCFNVEMEKAGMVNLVSGVKISGFAQHFTGTPPSRATTDL